MKELTSSPQTPQLLELLTKFSRINFEKIIDTLRGFHLTFHLSASITKNNLRLLTPYSPQICPNVCTDHYNKNQIVK